MRKETKAVQIDSVYQFNNLEKSNLRKDVLRIQFSCSVCNTKSEKSFQSVKRRGLICENCIKQSSLQTKSQNILKRKEAFLSEFEKQDNRIVLKSLKDVETILQLKGMSNLEIQFTCEDCGKLYKTAFRIFQRNPRRKLFCNFCEHKNTNLERYGVESTNTLESVKQKKVAAFQKHFGVNNPSQSEEVKTKMVDKFLEKYGVKNPFQSEEVKAKIRKTNLEKYGVIYPYQLQFFQEKYKETCLKRYGVENPFQLEEVHQKAIQVVKEKYGEDFFKKSTYFFDSVFFDSSWELAVWIWAKDNGKSIKREPLYFEYKDSEGKKHKYYPDFEIDGKLIEIKGDHLIDKAGILINVFSKQRLFEKTQCLKENHVEIWQKAQLKDVFLYVENTYGKNYLKNFKRR